MLVKKILLRSIITLHVVLLLVSCKPQVNLGSGSDGGAVPTADDLNNYIDRMTTPEDKTCDDLKTDIQRPKKFPIIYPAGKFQWKNEYSQSISDQLDKDYMRPMRKQKLNEGDLSLIGCKGYNYATDAEKSQFWILFLSALSLPESGFYPDEEYTEVDQKERTVSTGLLQIDPKASNDWCGILSTEMKKVSFESSDMHNPKTNLQCGLLMMQTQITGVLRGKPLHQSSPQFEGRLFTGDEYWYWAPLSDKRPDKKKQLIDWFSVHAQRQLKFCNRTNPLDGYTPGLSVKYKEMDCKEVQIPKEKENCEKYLINAKIEEGQTDPRLGENPADSSCRKIDNSGRVSVKDSEPKKELQLIIDSNAIQK